MTHAINNVKRKRIIHVSNNKGGVGKTVFAKILLEWLRSFGTYSVAAYDADGGVGGLVASYGVKDAEGFPVEDQDPFTGVAYFDVRSAAERGMLLNCLETQADIIVVDTAGGSFGDLTEVTDAGEGCHKFVRHCDRHGYRLTVVSVISNVVQATNSVGVYLDALNEGVDHLVVRNLAFGKAPGKNTKSDFVFYDGFTDELGQAIGGTARKQLFEMGGSEISLPAIPPATFAKVEAMCIPYSEAEDCRRLQIAERSHVFNFREDAFKQFETAKRFFLPVEAEQ